jgi:hypothetical protein
MRGERFVVEVADVRGGARDDEVLRLGALLSRPVRSAQMRRSLALAAVTFVLVPAANAHAATVRCKSADLRYPFQRGGPKTFGVFHLRVTRGSCPTAHRVAKAWMKRFEAELKQGRVKLPKHVTGFTFKSLPPTAAQTYRLRGVKETTRINFDYVVPNG